MGAITLRDDEEVHALEPKPDEHDVSIAKVVLVECASAVGLNEGFSPPPWLHQYTKTKQAAAANKENSRPADKVDNGQTTTSHVCTRKWK